MDKENGIYIHNELLFNYKKNEVLSFVAKWVLQIENITLSEISQTQRHKNCLFSFACGS